MGTFDNIDSKWKFFLQVVDKHAPIKKIRVRSKSLPWITDEVRSVMSKRSHTLSKARKTNSEDWIKYRNTRNHVTSILRKAKCNYFRLFVESSRGNPKNLWSELNKVLGKSNRANITLLQSHDGDLTNQDDIANRSTSIFPLLLANISNVLILIIWIQFLSVLRSLSFVMLK